MQWIAKNAALPANDAGQEWTGVSGDGHSVVWKGLGVGPVTLSESKRTEICCKLLGAEPGALRTLADQSFRVVSGEYERSVILHSTTPGAGAFEGDLAKLRDGHKPKNYAGYVETRAVYLGQAGDLAIGRMESWKTTATLAGLQTLEVPGAEYYHLIDALLTQAEAHLESPSACILQLAGYLQTYPEAVIRLYGLNNAMQTFLIWLKQTAGLDRIFIDANSRDLANALNSKNILYPAVDAARQMDIPDTADPFAILEQEQKQAPLYQKLGLEWSGLPGYTIRRRDVSLADFTRQILLAAELLRLRYGLEQGCLKSAGAGDGANITPGIDLKNEPGLRSLAENAYPNCDDYVLESQFYYATATIGDQEIKLAPSAHIRAGMPAPGITLQFTEGTSWAGNIFIDEALAQTTGISAEQYRYIRQMMSAFLEACRREYGGLAVAGIDFAIGRVGGKFGDDLLLCIQDPNISFNGAEFLRTFMTRVGREKNRESSGLHAATRVFIPAEDCTHASLSEHLSVLAGEDVYTEIIAIVPGYWGMIGVAAPGFRQLVRHLDRLKKIL
ncbi:MAG: hypothetical protein H6575_20345 [Lewinellaceae bacterium]|nr:hypothetical protein [Lewinellaceae bacterium]